MLVVRIDKVFRHDVASVFEARNESVEASAHVRWLCQSASRPEFAGDEAAVFLQRFQYHSLDAVVGRSWKSATAPVAEVGPPFAADESCLAGEEFSVRTSAFAYGRAFPFPQGPFPSAFREGLVAAFPDGLLFGRPSRATHP